MGKLPMGVSQWLAHGKKCGYYEYFRDEILSEIEKRLPEPVNEEENIYKLMVKQLLSNVRDGK